MIDARRALGVLALACTLALTGCTPDRPAEPSPSPTPAVPTPSETAQERQERLDYAAAEKSYRTFRAEYNRVLRNGGAKEPTKLMKATAGGQYLRELTQIIVGYHSQGSFDRGAERIRLIRHGGYSRADVILDVCEDGRAITTVVGSKELRGEIRTAHLEVRKTHGTWKVWSGSGAKVESC